MDLLIALIPALPLAGFLFAVLAGPRLDRVPTHGHSDHGEHGDDHGGHAGHRAGHGEGHAPVDDSAFRTVPSEEEQRETSPHAGHADDLANSSGADGVIPEDLNDGIGQAGHVVEGGEQPRYLSWVVPVTLVAIMWAISMVVFANVVFGGHTYQVALYEWIGAGDFHVRIAFTVDGLTAMLLLVVSTVGLLVHVYSIGYMNGDRGFWRFFAYLNLFMFSMLLLILGDNFLMLYVGWEAVGLCSYALIGFWYKKPSAAGAAKKAFIVNRIGDFGFGLGVIAIWVSLGTLQFDEVFAKIGTLDPGLITLIALLLFAGAVGKSAQFPLHVWLPDAMEGPTPVSALIHAATMVNAGVYLVARANPIFAESATAMWVVAGIGTFTALLAAAIALTQNDIKKVLAYSTVSQLAYMFMALGIGAWVAAIFHLAAHGFFKGLLFMGSGSVIHGASGEQDMRFLGGLRDRMKWTYRTMVVGSLALAGIPIFAGFFSKDEILGETFSRGYYVFYVIGVIVAFMTAFYTFRMIYMTFLGSWRGPREAWRHVHEARRPWSPARHPGGANHPGRSLPGIPPESGIIHDWLGSVFEHTEEAGVLAGSLAAGGHGFELFGFGGLLLLIGAWVGRPGSGWRTAGTSRDPEAPRRFVARIPFGLGPGMYAASLNKYYIDDIYQLVFARGGVLLGNALWWFDAKVIDGAVNGAGWVAPRRRTPPQGADRAGRELRSGHGRRAGPGAGLPTSWWCADAVNLPVLSLGRLHAGHRRAVLIAVPGDHHRAIRWVALLAAPGQLWLQPARCSATGSAGPSSSSPRTGLDPGLRDALPGGRGRHLPVLVILTTSSQRGGHLLLLGPHPEAGQGVLRRHAAPDGGDAGRLRQPGPLPLLRLLGDQPDPHVPGDRDLGRPAADLRHRQVRDLHPGRLAADAGGDPGGGHRPRGRTPGPSPSATWPCAAIATPMASRRLPSSPSSWRSPSRCRCGRSTPGFPMRTWRRPRPAPSSWPGCC